MIYKLFFILALLVNGPSDNEDVLEWDENIQLKWSDFKGQPQDLGDIVAITSSGISFKFSIKEGNGQVIEFNTQVQAHFYPKRSWVHKKKSSDHILAHEQLHFDITELHVRKLKSEISQLEISNNIKQHLNQTYKYINRELAIMQHTYDIETNYSRNAIMQSAWKIKVDNALKRYGDYKNIHKK